jgi:integrase
VQQLFARLCCTLAQMMGHNSLAMIQQVYAHLSPSDAYRAMVKVLLAENGEE